MNAFKSHPSVRIKGTENNYEPIICEDVSCRMQRSLAPHLHCPFCAKTEVYQDPVILKAHYRVKHVDKGIEFAGLKVVRCCNTCAIVGSIKGSKEFKGAHWHCYRCKNGFNRRDEALKHYKTHFRNPQTTFQIQICQDVNQDLVASSHMETEQATEIIRSENIVTILHPTSANTENSVLSNGGGNVRDGELQVGVGANEIVDSSSGEQQTIMIIADQQTAEQVTTADIVSASPHNGGVDEDEEEENDDTPTLVYMDEKYLTDKEESTELRKVIENQHQEMLDLKNRMQQIEEEKSQLESLYKDQVEQLKLQLEIQTSELEASRKREEELLQHISVPLTDKVQDLLLSMKCQHENLLHQQLAQLKRSFTLDTDMDNRVFYIGNMDEGSGEGQGLQFHNIVGTAENKDTVELEEDEEEAAHASEEELRTDITLQETKQSISLVSKELTSQEQEIHNGEVSIIDVKTEDMLNHDRIDHAPTEPMFSEHFNAMIGHIHMDSKRKNMEEEKGLKKKRPS